MLWNYVRNRYQKIFENNHIFSSAMQYLPKETFDLAIESLKKVKRLKKKKTQRVISEKTVFTFLKNLFILVGG